MESSERRCSLAEAAPTPAKCPRQTRNNSCKLCGWQLTSSGWHDANMMLRELRIPGNGQLS